MSRDRDKSSAGSYGERFDDDFQTHVLACMARVPGFVIRFRTALSAEFFDDRTERAIVSALLTFVDTEKELPSQPLLNDIAKDEVDESAYARCRTKIKEIFDVSVHDHAAVSRRVVEFGKLQACINATIENSLDLDRGENSKILDRTKAALRVGEDILDQGINWNEAWKSREAWYLPEKADPMSRIPTGIRHLDLIHEGGTSRGELHVVMAPPGKGKTTLLVNIGFGALRSVHKYKVVHYTCELADWKTSMRYDARLAGDLVGIRKSEPHKYLEMLRKRAKLLRGGLMVKRYPTRSLTPTMLRSHLSLLASEGHKADIVIVDYGDIMRAERRLGETRHEVAGVFEDLREIAEEYQVVMWTATQANKAAFEKPELNLADLAESFEKAHIADGILALCQTEDERIDKICRLKQIKLRDAEDQKTVECDILRDRCLIESTALYLESGVKVNERTGAADQRGQKAANVRRVSKADDDAGKKRPKKRIDFATKKKTPRRGDRRSAA